MTTPTPGWTLPRELVALNRVVTELATLTPAERRRVLNYLNDRYQDQPDGMEHQ